jgi:hypothetical protein
MIILYYKNFIKWEIIISNGDMDDYYMQDEFCS